MYLVVFVGGVVLEKYDALTVQTPVVPFSLLRLDRDGMKRGNGTAVNLGFAHKVMNAASVVVDYGQGLSMNAFQARS